MDMHFYWLCDREAHNKAPLSSTLQSHERELLDTSGQRDSIKQEDWGAINQISSKGALYLLDGPRMPLRAERPGGQWPKVRL